MGIIVPAINPLVEEEFHVRAPVGVSVYTARVIQQITSWLAKESLDSKKSLRYFDEVVSNIEVEAKKFSDLNVDIIGYCCTTGSFIKGPEWDKELTKKMELAAKVRAITTSTAAVTALKALEIKNVAVVTPYEGKINERLKRFLEHNNFNVVNLKSLCCVGTETYQQSFETIYRLTKEVNESDADGIFVSCTGFRAHENIDALEQDLGKPVVTAVQATLWDMLRKVGVREQIKEYGKLFTL